MKMTRWIRQVLIVLLLGNFVLEVTCLWKGCPIVNYKCAQTCMKKLHTKGRCVGLRCECLDPAVAWGGSPKYLPIPIPFPQFPGGPPFMGLSPGMLAGAALFKKAKAKKLKGAAKILGGKALRAHALQSNSRPAVPPPPPPPPAIPPPPQPSNPVPPPPQPRPRPQVFRRPPPPPKQMIYSPPPKQVFYSHPQYQQQSYTKTAHSPVETYQPPQRGYSKTPSQTMTIYSRPDNTRNREYNPDVDGDNRPDVFEHQEDAEERHLEYEDETSDYSYEGDYYYYEDEDEQ